MTNESSVMVRVVLMPRFPKSEVDYDPDAFHQIIMDLKRVPESQLCVGPSPAFGLYGTSKRSDKTYPFVLLSDGTVDFGEYADSDDRRDVLNIRSRKLAVGEFATYRSAEGEEWPYEIRSVTPL